MTVLAGERCSHTTCAFPGEVPGLPSRSLLPLLARQPSGGRWGGPWGPGVQVRGTEAAFQPVPALLQERARGQEQQGPFGGGRHPGGRAAALRQTGRGAEGHLALLEVALCLSAGPLGAQGPPWRRASTGRVGTVNVRGRSQPERAQATPQSSVPARSAQSLCRFCRSSPGGSGPTCHHHLCREGRGGDTVPSPWSVLPPEGPVLCLDVPLPLTRVGKDLQLDPRQYREGAPHSPLRAVLGLETGSGVPHGSDCRSR